MTQPFYDDLVQETSTTTGTGSFTLSGAVAGYRAFSDVRANGDPVRIAIRGVDSNGVPNGEWEICDSVYSGGTLTRGTLRSSSTGSRVNFSAGTKRVASVLDAGVLNNLLFTQPYSVVVSDVGGIYRAATVEGGVISSGTDAGPVWQAAVNAQAALGGKILIRRSKYDVYTLQHETTGGNDHYYAVGFPGNLGTDIYGEFYIEGEGQAWFVGNWSGVGVQAAGTILNITQAALDTLTGTPAVMGIWARPDLAGATRRGNNINLAQLGVRFPTNQRGNICGIQLQEAETTSFINVSVDTAVASGSLAAPVAGANGSVGIVSNTASKGSGQYFRNCFVNGWHTGYRISELATMIDCTSFRCTHAGKMGGDGNASYHPITLVHFIDQECINGWYITNDVQSGALVSFTGHDIEFAVSGTWTRSTDNTEQTAGRTRGHYSYCIIQKGVGIATHPFWTSGSGGNYQQIGAAP